MRMLSELFRPRRPSAKEPRTFRPSCEALEDRLAPSCTVALNNQTGELLVSGDNANDTVAISRLNSLGTDYVRVVADHPGPVVSFSGMETFRLYTAQSATVVDNHGSGYTFEHLQGAPTPSGATAASASTPGATDAMLPALTPSSNAEATPDLYWVALAHDPQVRPGLV